MAIDRLINDAVSGMHDLMVGMTKGAPEDDPEAKLAQQVLADDMPWLSDGVVLGDRPIVRRQGEGTGPQSIAS